jgi:hypothetical protein
MSPSKDWLKFAPQPEPLPEGKTWHVFLSYRSVHRPWVLQLYDVLRSLKFEVFVDQFVLRANDNLVRALATGLDESVAAILVWSQASEDSAWCQKEYDSLDRRETQGRLRYGVVRLGDVELPGFAADKVYVDFPEPQVGPGGLPLLRLLWGVVGKPLPPEAVQFGVAVDEEIRLARNAIHSAKSAGNAERLRELARTDTVAWRSTPVLRCEAAECMIKLEQHDDALTVLEGIEADFPGALRPKQLKGLALARAGRTEEAQQVLGELEAAGSRDPETLGIYARTWMDRYKATGNKLFLRRSRNLYLLAFDHTPSDTYVGINAASKSVMLGEPDIGRELATKVAALVGTSAVAGDYWKTATVAEIQLLAGNYDQARKLYQNAVDGAPAALGDHRSTRNQVRELMKHLTPSDADRAAIEAVFAHLEG